MPTESNISYLVTHLNNSEAENLNANSVLQPDVRNRAEFLVFSSTPTTIKALFLQSSFQQNRLRIEIAPFASGIQTERKTHLKNALCNASSHLIILSRLCAFLFDVFELQGERRIFIQVKTASFSLN
ncbi:hypothetical protein CEXT_492241 [Caerostris extrusa]|uniref:Uncharacterized protein n=1 Tax=Caerostris extrusa TaxID=172846 RepID=A0AAV4TTE1_CAEEX|nr:hypothetical protein CEXT_492241 [Caerostris extrusa]